VAQVDLGRTGAHAPAIGRKPEVAGRIELGVERRPGPGEFLQHLANGGQASALDVIAVEGMHRHLALQLSLLDAGAGDLDAVQGGGAGRRVALILGHGSDGKCEQYGQLYSSGKGAAVQALHPFSPEGNVWPWRPPSPRQFRL
jgi:hypothetical protein